MKYFKIALTILPIIALHAIDNPHFYRANFFWGEPRFEKPWLLSIDANIGFGHAKTGRNSDGARVPILDIYGLQNMKNLGLTAGLNPADPLDAILINLAALPNNGTFGSLEFTGKFSITEGTLSVYQNFTHGFFSQLYIPIRHLKVCNTNDYIDQSPTVGFPNSTTPEWLDFLNNFDAILAQNNLSKQPVNEYGTGDLSLLLGWTTSYLKNPYLDYIDVTGKIGILLPTSKKASLQNPFFPGLGYNGHYGIPVKFDISIGYWEWLTLGCHIGSLFLLEKKDTVHMSSVADTTSYFPLLIGSASIDPGTIWELSAYAKADHFWRGLSLLYGYTFTQEDRSTLEPENFAQFDPIIVNNNATLKGWDMHAMHFNIEWDFATTPQSIGPRLGLFYNLIIGGKRIYNTAITDSYGGIDVTMSF